MCPNGLFRKRVDVALKTQQVADGVVVLVAIEPPHHDGREAA